MLEEQPPPGWGKWQPWTIKYVDDLTAGEQLFLGSAISTFTTGREVKNIHASNCEKIFETVRANAERMGMLVNEDKTHLLCIASTGHNSIVRSHVGTGEHHIESESTMKMLGFMMDNKAGMGEHVKLLKRKVGSRMWLVIHLKRMGLDNRTLTRIYTTAIRQIIKYACQLYHYMLTSEQDMALEGFQ